MALPRRRVRREDLPDHLDRLALAAVPAIGVGEELLRPPARSRLAAARTSPSSRSRTRSWRARRRRRSPRSSARAKDRSPATFRAAPVRSPSLALSLRCISTSRRPRSPIRTGAIVEGSFPIACHQHSVAARTVGLPREHPPGHRLPGLHRPPAGRRAARARRRRTGRSPWSSRGWSRRRAEAAAAHRRRTRIEIARRATSPSARLGPRPTTRYERLAAEVGVVHHLAAIYDLAVPRGDRPAGQRRRDRQRARLLPRRRRGSSASTTSAPPTSPATAPASSTSTSSTSARASRTTTSRPSSRPRSGSAS